MLGLSQCAHQREPLSSVVFSWIRAVWIYRANRSHRDIDLFSPDRAEVRQEWSAAVEAERARRRGADFDEEPVPPSVASVEIPNSTAEALFSRLSADWKMIGNAEQARLKEPRFANLPRSSAHAPSVSCIVRF